MRWMPCGSWKLTLLIEAANADGNIFTPLVTSLRDLALLKTYMAIDSVATGRIPSLFCVNILQIKTKKVSTPKSVKKTPRKAPAAGRSASAGSTSTNALPKPPALPVLSEGTLFLGQKVSCVVRL